MVESDAPGCSSDVPVSNHLVDAPLIEVQDELMDDCIEDILVDQDEESIFNVINNEIDVLSTPGGTKNWFPYVPIVDKPVVGAIYESFEAAYQMYKLYAGNGGFNIRKSGIKRHNGIITHRYVYCNRAGKCRSKFDMDSLKVANDAENLERGGDVKRKRKTVTTVTGCLAKICFKAVTGTDAFKVNSFVEEHNHPLFSDSNMDLSRTHRQLHFSDYVFIHRASLSNLGATKAHRLKVCLMGGYERVRGTPMDWRNVRRSVNLFIGDRDAQMLVNKMVDRSTHVPGFSFEHCVVNSELVSMLWADETMKANYDIFGDVVSFDATFRTNKYDFVFVPFTGIDHNGKCVTFAAALLSDETYGSYCWLLEAFKKVNKRQPSLVLTDQDPALRNAILKSLPESRHRLCMWHITQKLPGKVLGDLDKDSKFRKDFHKLIWNVYIEPDVFEERWVDLISRYNLHQNKWLSDMYAIKDRWIPAYFKDAPMCGLMKTTSRSESSNAFFQQFSHNGNTFVQFMLCFEAAMEKQRYTQRVMDNSAYVSKPAFLTNLPIEQHAMEVYSHTIFWQVQKEIFKGLAVCKQSIPVIVDDVQTCTVTQKDKHHKTVQKTEVVFCKSKGTVNCSCGHYNRHGWLCRHIFCVFGENDVDNIPIAYINPRWSKKPLPAHLIEVRHRYGPCIEETQKVSTDCRAAFEDCVSLIGNDVEQLNELLVAINELKIKFEAKNPPPIVSGNKEQLYSDLLGVKEPELVEIKNPQKSSNKGSKRMKSAAEISQSKNKPKTSRKVPFKSRECGNCGQLGHYRTTCVNPKKVNMKEIHAVDEDDVVEDDLVEDVVVEEDVDEVEYDDTEDEDVEDVSAGGDSDFNEES